MVADVEDCIAAHNQPELQPPLEMELDELYNIYSPSRCASAEVSAGFVKNLNLLLINTSYASSNSIHYFGRKNLRFSIKWHDWNNNANNKKWSPPSLTS